MNTLETMKKISHRDEIPILLKSFNHSIIICEVGVQNAIHFTQLLTENVIKAYAVDSWTSFGTIGQNDSDFTQEEMDYQYKMVVNKFENDNRVEIMKTFSSSASETFPDEYFDFIYIDADHTYDAVLEDLNKWYPKLKKGGIISGHDYIDGDYTLQVGHLVRFGVIDAVSDFRKWFNIPDENFHVSNEQYASFFIFKN
jgi:Methyltransferase domain